MTNQAKNPPVVHVDNIDIPVIVYEEHRVLTTDLLAQVYDTELKHIQNNFSRNQDRFEEGKHYFKLEGEYLRDYKKGLTGNIPASPYVSKNTRNLILWTERGAARHAKMINTDKAWDIFEKLEDAYFEPLKEQPSSIPAVARSTRTLVIVENGQVSYQAVDADAVVISPSNTTSLQTLITDCVPVDLLHIVLYAASRRMQEFHKATLQSVERRKQVRAE